MGTLAGKVAIVTGASKGIGAGIALRLAADGASVVVNYSRSAKEAEALVAKITAAGGKAFAVQADISQSEQITSLFEATIKEFAKLDILVNNAGIYEFGGLDAVTPEHIDRQYALNVKGLILATQAAARLFPAEGGVVINISSGVAKTPMVVAQVYSSTKGAVDVLTRGLALELGPRKIRVVGIAPGLTTTEGTSGMDQGTIDFVVSRTPLGRIGESSDIAAAVSFVASADGSWITGETIQVGGGLAF
ncbi:3-oxoacyl-[acyl-carrier protein] reductase [Granulicella aggregans]|uniref:3-oxoacyl-[acyl-carrier protein] reductase n=1 Tax=Granulicella aggregans TaxID=474949 RepID=A0A7W7ZB66_9BACT|nr:glucose 1-dehydrogenase [Granulicella aggregans]MBB5056648.1 3-oxoacyl-[acyl-carrier protein] reductase [Granulicella aggregans]